MLCVTYVVMILHELAHCLAAVCIGLKISHIDFYPFGVNLKLKNKLVALKEKEDELQVDADKLQDPDYIARYAREKYSYSKDGEIILRIP